MCHTFTLALTHVRNPIDPPSPCARAGLRAAKAAGMRCVVTESGYTAGEDFALADAIFPEIGDEGSEQFSLQELCVDYFPVDA